MQETGFWIYALIAFVVFDLLLVMWIFFRRLSKKLPSSERQYIVKNWQRIEEMYLNDPKHAVFEADKLLDYALKKVLKSNDSLGVNLKNHGAFFSNLNSVWFAHKLRNKLAHELNANVSDKDFDLSKRYFRQALKDLGM